MSQLSDVIHILMGLLNSKGQIVLPGWHVTKKTTNELVSVHKHTFEISSSKMDVERHKNGHQDNTACVISCAVVNLFAFIYRIAFNYMKFNGTKYKLRLMSDQI